jgi:hypothetical protein
VSAAGACGYADETRRKEAAIATRKASLLMRLSRIEIPPLLSA